MSTSTPTEQKLQTIVAHKLKSSPDQVPLDQSLLEDMGLDSLDVMSAILEIEEAFAPVKISDRAVDEVKTLRELAAYIDGETKHG